MSCLCSSGNKTFLFVGSNHSSKEVRNGGCTSSINRNHITSLTTAEYDVIRSCKPITPQGHKLGLVYNWTSNETTNCSKNITAPYFWEGKRGICVDGFPVTTANNRPAEPGCKAAVISAGSSNDVSWVSCGKEYPFICRQLNPAPHGIPACEEVMTTNSRATTIAVTMPLAFILILLILLCLRYYYVKKRENRREELNIDPQYEQCNLATTSAKVLREEVKDEASQHQNEATEAYSHLSFFKKIKKNNEDYDTLTLNPVSVSSFKPEQSCAAVSKVTSSL